MRVFLTGGLYLFDVAEKIDPATVDKNAPVYWHDDHTVSLVANGRKEIGVFKGLDKDGRAWVAIESDS